MLQRLLKQVLEKNVVDKRKCDVHPEGEEDEESPSDMEEKLGDT
jgi:hypothetical protein